MARPEFRTLAKGGSMAEAKDKPGLTINHTQIRFIHAKNATTLP